MTFGQINISGPFNKVLKFLRWKHESIAIILQAKSSETKIIDDVSKFL